MKPMRIRALGLSHAEIALIRRILELSSALNGSWTVIDNGDHDVLLHVQESESLEPSGGRNGQITIPVVRGHQYEFGTALGRPIRAEELISVLMRIQAARKGTGEPDTEGSRATADTKRRARLKKWPIWAQAEPRKQYLPLISMLSRGARSPAELSTLSGKSMPECLEVFNLLNADGLLSWQTSATNESPPSVRPPVNAAAHAAFRFGLLSSIRRRLGLT